MNHITATGRLTYEPELRYTPKGALVLKASLAINEYNKLPNGDTQEITTFIDVEAWGALADRMSKTLAKGDMILVSGNLRMSQWETDKGEKRSRHHIRASEVLSAATLKTQENNNTPTAQSYNQTPKPTSKPEVYDPMGEDDNTPF